MLSGGFCNTHHNGDTVLMVMMVLMVIMVMIVMMMVMVNLVIYTVVIHCLCQDADGGDGDGDLGMLVFRYAARRLIQSRRVLANGKVLHKVNLYSDFVGIFTRLCGEYELRTFEKTKDLLFVLVQGVST